MAGQGGWSIGKSKGQSKTDRLPGPGEYDTGRGGVAGSGSAGKFGNSKRLDGRGTLDVPGPG
jgi:hypothetical protein